VRTPLAVLGLVGALAAVAAAQPAGYPSGRPGRPGQPKKPPAEKSPDALPEGEIRVRAGNQEQSSAGHWKFRDFVDVRMGDMRIQADRADVDETEKPDGTKGHKLVAEGNVVFLRGEERLAGDRLEIEDTGHGTFTNASGYVEPGVWVEGKVIERIDDDTYRVEGGSFTSCAQPNPRWGFSASSATIDVGDKIVAKNALFKVKSVPAFYVPVLYYPIRNDQRSTGFLLPHIGNSSTRGFNVGTGFFWAMGRSADQTFYADHYSNIGWGFGQELRYVQDAPSRGLFRTYAFNPLEEGGSWDWDIDWNALQMLPGKVKATLNVRQYSNLLFQQRFQDNFNYATTRTKRSAFAIQRNFGSQIFQASVDETDTYFGDSTRVQGHLPSVSLRRFPKQIGKTGIVIGYEAHADDLKNGYAGQADTYWRYDFAPEVSRPLSVSFLTVTPQVRYRYTRYETSKGVDEAGETALVGDPINRSFAEAGLDIRGPNFSRVFNTPGGFYSDRFKHIIGPEISWTYRTRVEDFNFIPQFDGIDYFLGTNQINYGIVQRFLAKRPGAGGKPTSYEFLSWRVSQTYYVQIADGQNNFDPNYSSSAFGPGFKPEHLSPLLSRFRLRPTPSLSVDQTLEYDVNYKQIRRSSVYTTLGGGRFNVTGGWSRSVRLSDKVEERTVVANSLRGAAGLKLLPNKLTLSGSADYDYVNKLFWNLQGRIRYEVQCCGFSAEVIKYNYNGRDERQFRFSIELANVGSIGNFMGGERPGQGGLGGYR
jgi:LPS-assembly protein